MQRNRAALVLSGTWFFVFSMVMLFPKFAIFMGTAKGPKPFMDLQQVLTTGDCKGLSLERVVSGACDPWHRPWCYGVWMIHVVQFLHLSNHFYLLIGWVNAILIAICLGFMTRFFVSKLIWSYLAAFSPPIFFLAERGNTDTWIMILVLIFVFAVIRDKGRWFFWIPALLMAYKIYPGGIIMVFTKLKDFLWASFAAILFAFLWVRDIHTIIGNQPHCRGWSFGNIVYYSQSWRCYDNGVISTRVTIELAVVTVLFWFAAFLFFKFFKPNWLSESTSIVNKNMPAKILIKASGIIFLVSFLGVTVVDYKLWSVILLAFGVTSLDFGKRKFTRWTLLGLIFLGLWGSRVTPEWVQYLSNWDLILLTFVVFLYFTQDLVEELERFFSKRKIRSI